jgi:cyclase
MKFNPPMKFITRREMLRRAGAISGGALAGSFYSSTLLGAAIPAVSPPASPGDPLAASRARYGAMPIQREPLTDSITLLSGPGGNVVVLDGADGKLVGDTFVMPAWPHFKEALESIGKTPVKVAIDTHWHFDHSDNNAALRAAGATVVAHENTRKRMSETNTLPVLNMTIPASPREALPEKTFRESRQVGMNGESVSLVYVPPAHTDSDIYIHFEKANVLQAGDIFFNGTYPYIDSGTGGSVSGMIAGLTKLLAVADSDTKIVPGHGPLGGRADLLRFREMLSIVRERLEKFKSSGKPVEEVIAAKPLDDLDAAWGKGLNNSDTFVRIAYLAL